MVHTLARAQRQVRPRTYPCDYFRVMCFDMIDVTFLRFIDVASGRAVPAKDSPARRWRTTSNLGSRAIPVARVPRGRRNSFSRKIIRILVNYLSSSA